VEDLPPFDLAPLGDGCYELRAFSDDSSDPITVALDPATGRRLALVLGEALALVDTPGAPDQAFEVSAGRRCITVAALPGKGVRLTVTR
jgi:hypothetical protein